MPDFERSHLVWRALPAAAAATGAGGRELLSTRGRLCGGAVASPVCSSVSVTIVVSPKSYPNNSREASCRPRDESRVLPQRQLVVVGVPRLTHKLAAAQRKGPEVLMETAIVRAHTSKHFVRAEDARKVEERVAGEDLDAVREPARAASQRCFFAVGVSASGMDWPFFIFRRTSAESVRAYRIFAVLSSHLLIPYFINVPAAHGTPASAVEGGRWMCVASSTQAKDNGFYTV